MIEDKPRLSIGLPVFNGEKYIEAALDSILAQNYKDFELIISDNASTDNTSRICRAYAAKDSRIRYYRNMKNLGATRNHNRVFELSSGKYFKWAAHDDLLAPEFLSRCVSVLDQDSSIVLCHSKTARIDEDGKLIGPDDYETIVDSRNPHKRFGDVINRNLCWMIFGVIRKDTLKMTRLMGEYIRADWNLLAEIALLGRIFEIPDYLFFRRDHPNAYTNKNYLGGRVTLPCYPKQLAWWTTKRSRPRIILPHWKICLEYFRSVAHVPMNLSDRLLCYGQIASWITRRGWRPMKWDISVALDHFRLSLRQ